MTKQSFVIVDALSAVGGQCSALYPEKPIYDIPALPSILAGDMINNLKKQLKPFNPNILLNEKIDNLEKTNDNNFILTTDKNTLIKAKSVIIGVGVGAFGPNRPPLENILEYEKTGCVKYFVDDKSTLKNKDVIIAGGGDSALDWAILLAEEEITNLPIKIVHRRLKFRGASASVEKMQELVKQGKIELVTPYQLAELKGKNGILQELVVKTLSGEEKILKCDCLLAFYGLTQNLGAITNWGLDMENSLIKVNYATQETNIKGIYAVGDVCSYEGKLKLILTGFSESALAVRSINKAINPDAIYDNVHSSTIGIPIK